MGMPSTSKCSNIMGQDYIYFVTTLLPTLLGLRLASKPYLDANLHPVGIKVTCRREQTKNFFSSLIVLFFHLEPAHEPSLYAK
ncbi:hypothetical protein CROQUDRAFT_509992 [Cronartium quercuum f. sp. fusiforme G11]|uniref:Uncharacterized protein n=1 Tax=Cronartium quercuum f. sp. fusiforme G11 TaxID=708437 RepID=A0A9P6NNE1_9BASI|nr:hypothetical protein CROQUDRAFT_509992 [Cronartium quercuum f. sp. fusiforme G11]